MSGSVPALFGITADRERTIEPLTLKENICYTPNRGLHDSVRQRGGAGEILELPDTLPARYIVLTRWMIALGPDLGRPDTEAFGDGLFELYLNRAAGIARVFSCTLIGRRIVMLRSFVKRTQRTPPREIALATERMKEVKHEDS